MFPSPIGALIHALGKSVNAYLCLAGATSENRLVWLNETNRMNQRNQMNKTNQMNQIRPSRLSRSSVLDSLPPMAPSPQHSARKLSHSRSLLLALLCLVCAACGTTAPTGKILFDDPRGTVSLQTISDRSIQASHPINLDPALLARRAC